MVFDDPVALAMADAGWKKVGPADVLLCARRNATLLSSLTDYLRDMEICDAPCTSLLPIVSATYFRYRYDVALRLILCVC